MQLTSLLLGICLFSTVVACPPPSAWQEDKLPAASELIDRFIAALGSEMKISGIEQVRIKARYTNPSSETTGQFELLYHTGKVLYRERTPEGGEVKWGFDGQSWWQQMGRTEEIVPMNDEQQAIASQSLFFTPRFLSWRDFDGTVEVVESPPFRGTDVWRLKFTDTNGYEVERMFDRDSGMLVASHTKTGAIEFVVVYEFEQRGDVMWLSKLVNEMTVEDSGKPHVTEVEFTEFDFDSELDESEFLGSVDK